jgi:hypothetical protein
MNVTVLFGAGTLAFIHSLDKLFAVEEVDDMGDRMDGHIDEDDFVDGLALMTGSRVLWKRSWESSSKRAWVMRRTNNKQR